MDKKIWAYSVTWFMHRLIIALLFAASAQAQQDQVVLNQEGFYTNGTKKAIVVKQPSSRTFTVIDLQTGKSVYRGETGPAVPSRNSATVGRTLDFTGFKSPGRYQLDVPGVGRSHPFVINGSPLYASALASIKGYYYQRVSQPLEEKHAGKWARPAGHADDSVLVHPSAASAQRPAGTVIKSPGGWYDAGDYNKYVVNSGITTATLLSAYEDFPQYFDTLRINIPESSNALPDLLDEVLVNLRWMLTMQDPHDGGVYHKMTNAAFDGMVMPGVTRLPRYVVQKSTAAALNLAAVTAQAARVLKQFEKQLPGLADSCLRSAKAAYTWARQNRNLIYDQDAMNRLFRPAITTGAYGNGKLDDEWFWASAELLVTTGDGSYVSELEWERVHGLQSWNNVGMMGVFTLARMTRKKTPGQPGYTVLSGSTLNKSGAGSRMIVEAQQLVLHFADSLLGNMSTNAFQTVMGGSPKDFEWGSNAVAANQGMVCIQAYLLSRNKKYLEGALSNADYILGRNATGYCFITGMGTRSPMHPHHRPSVADGIPEPVPGLLAGGPNPGRQDKCNYAFTEPETSYVDDDCSYASNEIAINWNAPLVYLLNGITAIHYSLRDER